MDRHDFGRVACRYLRYPVPAVVADLRAALYPRLFATANRWSGGHGIGPARGEPAKPYERLSVRTAI